MIISIATGDRSCCGNAILMGRLASGDVWWQRRPAYGEQRAEHQ